MLSLSLSHSILGGLGVSISKSAAQDMVNEVDADGSGLIEFDEFMKLIMMLALHHPNPNPNTLTTMLFHSTRDVLGIRAIERRKSERPGSF